MPGYLRRKRKKRPRKPLVASIYDALGWGIQDNNYNKPTSVAGDQALVTPQTPRTQSVPTNPLQFQGVPLDAGNSVGTGQRQTTTNTADPWRDFLLNMVSQSYSGPSGQIPGYTMGALENFTNNPAAAAAYFPQLAAPLLEANHAAQGQQTTALTDLFRKAGGTSASPLRSGAFAQAGQNLASDFARQDQETLAKAYTPLTQQLSDNMNNAIKAGISVPQATSESLKPLVGSLSSLLPLQTSTEGISIGPNPQVFDPRFQQQQQPTNSWLWS